MVLYLSTSEFNKRTWETATRFEIFKANTHYRNSF